MVQPPSARAACLGLVDGGGVGVGEAGEFDVDQFDERFVAGGGRFGSLGRVDRRVDVVDGIGGRVGCGDGGRVVGAACGCERHDGSDAEHTDHGEPEEHLSPPLFDRLGELRRRPRGVDRVDGGVGPSSCPSH